MENRGTLLALGCALASSTAAACGDTERNSANPSAGGSGGSHAVVAGAGAIGPPPGSFYARCAEFVGLDTNSCPRQAWQLPPGLSAGGAGGASSLDCYFPFCTEFLGQANFDQLNVAVDCTPIPYVAIDTPNPSAPASSWHFDDADNPTGIVLSDHACAPVRNGETEWLDAIFGCSPLDYDGAWHWDGTCTLPDE